MRILLVEDNTDFASAVERAIRQAADVEVIWAKSRDSALSKLAGQTFDLVILDRRIPTSDGFLDDHQDHGWRVFQHILEESPGTPVWFLTGTEDADFATEIGNDYSRRSDLQATGRSDAMYQVWWKKKMPECVRKLKEFASDRVALERVAVRLGAGEDQLRREEETVLRMFGRRYEGSVVDVKTLNGGLSDSRVLKVVVRNAYGEPLITAAAKVAKLSAVSDEAGRYRAEVVRLVAGSFPQLSIQIDSGAGKYGGLFYGLVGDSIESLFDRLVARHPNLASVPAELQRIEGSWYAAKRIASVEVAEIRRKLLSDLALDGLDSQLQGIELGPTESRVIRAARCCQHGDLHCANVLFTDNGQVMLIDFGDCGASFSAIDPVTLELSTVFHSQRSRLGGGWPNEEAMQQWPLPERFIVGCEFPAFIQACRSWGRAVSGSPDEIIASAYGYALRQLKYPDTDKALARALLRACIGHLRS